MGNRVIQAKVLKIKRRRFKMRTKSAGPYPGWAADYYKRVSSFRKPFFPKQDTVPPTVGQYTVDIRGERVLQNVFENLSVHFGDQDIPRCITLGITTKEAFRLYFSGTTYFLIHEHFEKREVKKSILYSSREKAIMAYKIKRVVWVERLAHHPALQDEAPAGSPSPP